MSAESFETKKSMLEKLVDLYGKGSFIFSVGVGDRKLSTIYIFLKHIVDWSNFIKLCLYVPGHEYVHGMKVIRYAY